MHSEDDTLPHYPFYPLVNYYLGQMNKAAGVYAVGEVVYKLDFPIYKARDINLVGIHQKPCYKRAARLLVLGQQRRFVF